MTGVLLAVIYFAFVSLGLPDGLLGAAWPTMGPALGVPVSWAGGISTVISLGTIVSALMSDRMTLRFGVGRVTACSVATTAVALMGFSWSSAYWMLLVCAVPYGLGAGGVDAALNNYVAVHYASRHMSWLHCMWGVGASVGPYVMSLALTDGHGWPWGYRAIGVIQMVLTAVLLCTLPLWRGRVVLAPGAQHEEDTRKAGDAPEGTASTTARGRAQSRGAYPMGLAQVMAIRGVAPTIAMFFCYCALETTTGLWAGSYMVQQRGVDRAVAAAWVALFFVGITVGRAVGGLLTLWCDDPTMIRLGQAILGCGLLLMMIPASQHGWTLAGLGLVGLGCAPIYPSIIHATPGYFGEERSQSIVGVQMAGAYTGSLIVPPVFGLIAQRVTLAWFPWCLLALLVVMVLLHERLRRTVGSGRRALS